MRKTNILRMLENKFLKISLERSKNKKLRANYYYSKIKIKILLSLIKKAYLGFIFHAMFTIKTFYKAENENFLSL